MVLQPFQSSWIANVPWHPMVMKEGYDILALHTQWNQNEVEKVLGEGAVYITILRDETGEIEKNEDVSSKHWLSSPNFAQYLIISSDHIVFTN